jgi:hypothetical protein
MWGAVLRRFSFDRHARCFRKKTVFVILRSAGDEESLLLLDPSPSLKMANRAFFDFSLPYFGIVIFPIRTGFHARAARPGPP